jgi:hypothetical protein
MRLGIAVLPLMALAACGGGGANGEGGGTPTPSPTSTPVNSAPVFSSPAVVSVGEHSTAPFYTAAATDPEASPVTYSITGGPDAEQFRLTSMGTLNFVSPPAYKDPTDAGADNVYQVNLAASDGANVTTLSLQVTVTDVTGNQLTLKLDDSGYRDPTTLVLNDNDSLGGSYYIFERTGRILYRTRGGTPTVVADIADSISTGGERGILGVTSTGERISLTPPFVTVTTFYVFVTNLAGDIEIRELRYQCCTITQPTSRVILRIPHQGVGTRYGGWIEINGGDLYIGTGDGGAAPDSGNPAQNTSSLLGKILRIDPTRDDFPNDPDRNYGIPAGNPFKASGGTPEVWALGLRDPKRGNFNKGDYPTTPPYGFVGDSGEAKEELNFVSTSTPALNYGWPFMDGTTVKNPALGSFTPPATEYQHGTGRREGGAVVPGVALPLNSTTVQYLFGDKQTGALWAVPLASLLFGQTIPSSAFILRRSDFAPRNGALDNPVSITRTFRGQLKLLDQDGDIFVVGGGG